MGGKRAVVMLLLIALVTTVLIAGKYDPTSRDAGVVAAPRGPAAGSHDGRHVLVRFDAGTSSNERASAHRKNAQRVVGRIDDLKVEIVRIRSDHTPEQAARRYNSDPKVDFAEPNFAYAILATPDDPFFPGNGSGPDLWGLHNTGQSEGIDDADIDAPEGWDIAGVATGAPWPAADYTIGIVDTGIHANHPDLAGRVKMPCHSFLGGTGAVREGCVDDHSHGTHVAGTAAAIGNNGRGVVGAAPNANVHMCKALDSEGSGWTSDVAACVDRLIDDRETHKTGVISMSLGGPPTQTLRLAVDRARDLGMVVFAAAGNDGNSNLHYPAGYGSVVSVAATDRDGDRASFSNSNDDVELAAPGVTTMSTVPGGGYETKSGTSMATPHAAAVAGLVSWQTGLSGQLLRDHITLNADDIGVPGRDPAFGFGRVNLCRALAGPCPPFVPPPPTPTPEPTPTPTPTWRTVDDDTSPALYRGQWSVHSNLKAIDGTFHRTTTPGSYVVFYFSGVGVRWIGQRTKAGGITAVNIDGVRVARVNAYAPTAQWQQTLFEKTGLPPGTHRLELILTAKKDPLATSYTTFVDAFSVFR